MEPRSEGLAHQLDALTTLAQESSSERRRMLLREATDVFFASTPPPPAVLALFDVALAKISDAMEAEVRAELARRLADAPVGPRKLLVRLGVDADLSVAEPVLTGSRALSESDLLNVASVAGQEHLRLVSRRDDLTESISEKIVERGDDDTVSVLVSNPLAPMSRETQEAVVERAAGSPALQEAVVGRQDLPLDLMNELYFVVENRLRDRIMARNDEMDRATLDAALKASRTRIAARDGVLPPDYEEASAYVDKLAAQGPIAPQTLVGFMRAGQHTRFLIALARAADIDYGTARRVVERRDFDALILLCQAADYDCALFRTLVLLLKPDDAVPVTELVNRFKAIPRVTALRVVRFWKVRRENALAAA